MGVALPALLTLWFLMPGALFWFGLRRGSGPTSTYFSAAVNQLGAAALWAPAVHVVGYTLLGVGKDCGLDFRPNFTPIVASLMAGKSAVPLPPDEWLFAMPSLFGYFFTVNVLGLGLGLFAHSLIRHYRLDRTISIFQVADRITYPLNGLFYVGSHSDSRFPDVPDPDFVRASVLCSSGDDFILYVGTLENFQIDANGQLEWVHLKDIRRRKLSEDRKVDQSFEEHAQTFYEVEATHLIIFGRTILNIAVTPFWLGETSNELTNT